MDWTQVLTIVASNMALFIWARTEANQDRRDMLSIIRSIEQEMKEFHARLLVIEKERR